MKSRVMTIMLVVGLLASYQAFAVDPTYTGYFSKNAIKGYDAVAYFTEGKAVAGDKKYSTEYNQAIWLFASQAHLDLFLGAPEKYAPQYGGYCAYAVSQNTTASIKPELFTIVDGKLYLNYSEKINLKWRVDKNRYIEAADRYWPGLLAE